MHLSPSATYGYTVSAGGSAGGRSIIEVTEYYQ